MASTVVRLKGEPNGHGVQGKAIRDIGTRGMGGIRAEVEACERQETERGEERQHSRSNRERREIGAQELVPGHKRK